MCARFIVYDLLQLKSCYSWFQWLYRLAVEEVQEEDYMLPLSEAEVHATSHPKWNKEDNFCITLLISYCVENLLWWTLKCVNQVIRQGSDVTLVGWGAQLSIMEQACLDAEKVSDCCIATEST